MKEVSGDFWAYKADWKLIPTNGIVKQNGDAVMGAGLARDARDRFPGIDRDLGKVLKRKGNLPTKEHFANQSTLPLIKRSAEEIRLLFDRVMDDKEKLASLDLNAPPIVLFPHLGCGYGGLRWENVRPLLQEIFPEDNFIAIAFDPRGPK